MKKRYSLTKNKILGNYYWNGDSYTIITLRGNVKCDNIKEVEEELENIKSLIKSKNI